MPPTEIRNLGSYEDKDIKHACELLISNCLPAMQIANALGGTRSTDWDIVNQYKNDDIFLEAKRRNLLKGLISAVDKQPIESTWAVKYLDNETKTEE